jgi:hypothetical protein
MKKYIIIGFFWGLSIPFFATIANELFPSSMNFDFLIYNPLGWIFVFPARLCQTEICANLFFMIGVIYFGWALLGGIIGFFVYRIKNKIYRI